jgi:hypothetical protein
VSVKPSRAPRLPLLALLLRVVTTLPATLLLAIVALATTLLLLLGVTA